MTDYQPPKNYHVNILDHKVGVTNTGWITPDEAISLGLALMETGLHLKAQAKLNHQPKE